MNGSMARDLMLTTGQDFAIQIFTTDYRGDPVPFSIPAFMTCRDTVGQIIFETTMEGEPDEDAMILTSEANGLIQVTIPRVITGRIPSGMYSYDIWATLNDTSTADVYPEGQFVPVLSGRVRVGRRITVVPIAEEIAP
jgi:hypothetical protein